MISTVCRDCLLHASREFYRQEAIALGSVGLVVMAWNRGLTHRAFFADTSRRYGKRHKTIAVNIENYCKEGRGEGEWGTVLQFLVTVPL